MSVDVNWESLTGGPDGAALAETIRDFIHERFQSIQLPKLIRSVGVHDFDFGDISPEIVLKDIGDPLPDFYETGDDQDDAADKATDDGEEQAEAHSEFRHPQSRQQHKPPIGTRRQPELDVLERSGTSSLTRGTTPGVLGTTSNLGYFHLPLKGGLPGTQTPLAAVAGAHYSTGLPNTHDQHNHRHADSFSSHSPPSAATPGSSQDPYAERSGSLVDEDDVRHSAQSRTQDHPDRSPDDMQVVFHVTYAGDVKMSLTADVFLDYPMPSFVGIPLKLNITGMTFNGVGILAYIKKRAHLCFLNPEDAEALVGGEPNLDVLDDSSTQSGDASKAHRVGALIEDIKIESEMGESDSGRQVLKNVGKIEKFILEQVQRIFEDEFVYPSFWTFLV
ncbi:Mitochondrial distribution and morphology protein 12 [Fulvia fulva]|nr:Mitochondrial distribution and morphology protein 12 [Fulvia fulva]